MHRDDLNKAWACHKCNAIFIYSSDKEHHAEILGHRRFAVFDLESGKMVRNEKVQTRGEFARLMR